MRNIYIGIITLAFVLGSMCFASAQQDPMFTKYMFNQLSYNPAYAGSYDFMSMNAVYRKQWWGIEDAPESQTFTIHTPLNNNKVGVGLSLINDAVGPTGTTTVNGVYAYHIPVTENSKLALGIQGGITNYRFRASEVNVQDNNDIAFAEDENLWLPNFGAGIYYYAKHFYVGASVPHIMNNDLRSNAQDMGLRSAQQFRHYFFMAGGMVEVSPTVKFKPSILVKNVGLYGEFKDPNSSQYVSAPTEFDLDLSLLFYDMLWTGVSFRSSFEAVTDQSSIDSGDLWIAYYFRNGLRMGVSYDYTLTKLQQPAQGSVDVMLGYDFNYDEKKIVTPRYF